MEPVIRTEGLTKDYGRHHALRDLELEVERGEVYGLLGPNGAGKTTTLRLLVDLIRPTSGRVRIFGLDLAAESVAIRGRLGYLPGDLALYPKLTGRELLALCGGLRGHPDLRHALELAERLQVDLTRKCGELSKGNRQKVGVVQAFLHRPELVLLDEPASGLDPLGQHELHRYLREYAESGGTVLFSSHVLSEVEQVADRVGIVLNGRLALVDRVAALKAAALRELELTFAGPVPAALFADLPGVREATAHGSAVRCRVSGAVGELVRVAAEHGLVNITSREPDLEEIFLDYLDGRLADVR